MRSAMALTLAAFLLGGCHSSSAPTPQKEVAPLAAVTTQQVEKWLTHQRKITGFTMKIAEGFKKVHDDSIGICFSRGRLERVAIVNWRLNEAVRQNYIQAFAQPENFQDATTLLAFEDLGAVGDIVEVKELKLKNARAFLFKTKHKRLLKTFYRTRIEIFPKYQDLQITLFFQHLAGTNSEIKAMINSILVGTRQIPENYLSSPVHQHSGKEPCPLHPEAEKK